ncbi:MAG: metallophosphoesterase [Clostridia bacterium]|nr:metallophosphoesterase [Clostridia bacterium]
MITFNKTPNKDFKILNLTDFQLMAPELNVEHEKGKIMRHTLDTLVEKVKPDLITITGDLAWGGDYDALMVLGPMLDKYKIPWAPLWGNHDQDRGLDRLDRSIKILSENKYFTYENGPCELGRGNYIIAIKENDKIIHALIMMDTHDRVPNLKSGIENDRSWAKLTKEQIEWYKRQVKMLKEQGCNESTLLVHIPIYAYRDAFKVAFNSNLDPKDISTEQSELGECWNEGYKDSFGVKYEDVCSYYEDDGVFDAIKELNHTKNVICGHDHVNCFSISYEGVRLTFALKTGPGCYWNEGLNGGTVVTISNDGKIEVKHEYVSLNKKS